MESTRDKTLLAVVAGSAALCSFLTVVAVNLERRAKQENAAMKKAYDDAYAETTKKLEGRA